MKRTIGLVIVLAVALGGVAAVGSAGASSKGDDHVLRSKLFGSQPRDPVTGTGGPILFGVTPGAVPWTIAKSDVDARRDGRLRVRFEGLLIVNTGTALDGTRGGVETVSASLYCNGMSVGETREVPLSADGDAEIRDTIRAAPDPCLAPAVLVHPNGLDGAYIAATGA